MKYYHLLEAEMESAPAGDWVRAVDADRLKTAVIACEDEIAELENKLESAQDRIADLESEAS